MENSVASEMRRLILPAKEEIWQRNVSCVATFHQGARGDGAGDDVFPRRSVPLTHSKKKEKGGRETEKGRMRGRG